MAACSSVSVLTPNGRRTAVKVWPNTPLLKVLEDVCQKHGFNAEDHGLKFQRTLVDLTLPWRFSNLPNNAKLEMVSSSKKQADSQVRVALQMEDGSRQQGSFSSGQTLWDLIAHFPQIRSSESGSTPVCVYMRDEVSGEEALKKATLKSLGLTGGSAIVRFLLKKEKTPEEEEEATPPSPVAKEPASIPSSTLVPSLPETSASTAASSAPPSAPPPSAPPPSAPPPSAPPPSAPPPSAPLPSAPPLVAPPPEAPPPGAPPPEAPPHQDSDSQDALRPAGGQTAEDGEEAGPSGLNSSSTSSAAPFIPFSGGGQRLGGPGGGGGGASGRSSSSSALFAAPVESPKAKKAKPSPASKCKAAAGLQNEDLNSGEEREPLLYHLDSITHQPRRQQQLPDSFFEVTVDDVRKRFAQLKSDRRLLEEAPLLTSSQRESQMKEKMERYPKVVLRIQFPDRHVLQGFFTPLETVGAVRTFVRTHLEDPRLSFYLFVTPPKTILDDDSATLFQADLFPGALVYFGCRDSPDSFIKTDLIKTSACHANQTIASSMFSSPSSSPSPSPSPSSSSSSPPLPPPSESSLDSETSSQDQTDPDTHNQTDRPRGAQPGKVPKWLKLPGKK